MIALEADLWHRHSGPSRQARPCCCQHLRRSCAKSRRSALNTCREWSDGELNQQRFERHDRVDRAQWADDRRWRAGDLRSFVAGVTVTFLRMAVGLQAFCISLCLAGGPGRRRRLGRFWVGFLCGGIGLCLITRPVHGPGIADAGDRDLPVRRGRAQLVLAFQVRPAAGSGWLLFDGIVTLVLAAMIWSAWPTAQSGWSARSSASACSSAASLG